MPPTRRTTRRVVLVFAAVSVAAVGFAVPSGANAASPPATIHFAGGGRPAVAPRASAHAARSARGAPALAINGTVYPTNALCNAIGVVYPNSAGATGSGFARNKNGSLRMLGRTVGTFTTDASGSFSTTATALNRPSGTYTVTARQSATRQATAPLVSSASSCVTASGLPESLFWIWQGVGFDANTEVDMNVGGVENYQQVETNAHGGFRLDFSKGCPATGTLSLIVDGTIDGQPTHFDVGQSVDCPPVWAQIAQPDTDYVNNTCEIDMSAIPEGTDVSQLTGCGETLSFSQPDGRPITKYSASDGYKWGTPPAVEPGTPDSLYAIGDQTLTITFSPPVSVAGLEIQPDRFICSHHPPENVNVTFNDAGGVQIGGMDTLLPGCSPTGGAQLFAGNTLLPAAKIGSIAIYSTGAACCSTYYSMARFRITP